jgi:sugar/nucleoside kinase (ribokinase family)
LNVDYVVSDADWASLPAAAREAARALFDPGAERLIDEADFRRIRRGFPAEFVHVRAGGSSFNAVRALRALRADVDLAFIGCQGEAAALDQAFDAFGIARTHVRRVADVEPGGCLAIQEGEERHLLTTRGANDEVAVMLAAQPGEMVEAAASATIVHVSSLLDPDAPVALLEVLSRAKALAPGLTISFDPGSQWTWRETRNPAVRQLFDLADLLFLNRAEGSLARRGGLLNGFRGTTFLKGREVVSIVHPDGVQDRVEIDALDRSHIRDSVGAGDVFAAGVLALLASEPGNHGAAARLGIAAASRKLADPAPFGPTAFRDLWRADLPA